MRTRISYFYSLRIVRDDGRITTATAYSKADATERAKEYRAQPGVKSVSIERERR